MCSKNYLPLSDEISKAFKIISTRDEPLTLDAPLSRPAKSTNVTNLWKANAGRVDQTLQTCILSYVGGSIIREWQKINDCTDCLATLSNPPLPNYFLTRQKMIVWLS